jgi:peptide/nickel transport system permease protein
MMSGQARAYLARAPWMTLFPAAALTLTVLSANMFADAMRDHLDPRLRGSR